MTDSAFISGIEVGRVNLLGTCFNQMKTLLLYLRTTNQLLIKPGVTAEHKTISTNLFELRMFFGPGFRVYYTIQGREIIFLLAGGDKSSQQKDIAKAIKLLNQLEV
jgi:putative addiction module killer protein